MVAITTQPVNRRDFVKLGLRGMLLLALVGVAGLFVRRHRAQGWVWQLDPRKCTQCGRCATNCVLEPSAVKCVHAFKMCGYCELCTGYFEPQPNALNTGAENQVCPVGALRRQYVEDPYYEYTIDEALCIGCGKCVKGCTTFGNGSLHLQVRHDRCLNCNECSIAIACPADAYRRVPAGQPYLMKA
jgi:Na+-translocating ferredoxin:NAD+ oxidoreductase subunit B